MHPISIFLVVIPMLCAASALAQDPQFVPSENPYDGPMPRWYFEYADPLFVKNDIDPTSTPYFGRLSVAQTATSDNLYILEATLSQSPYGGFVGAFVYKVDIMTGDLQWAHQRNLYTGLERRESHFGSIMNLKDGRLEILAAADELPLDLDVPAFLGFYTKPLLLSLDTLTGAVMDSVYIRQPDSMSVSSLPELALSHDDGSYTLMERRSLIDTNLRMEYAIKHIREHADTVRYLDTIVSVIPFEGVVEAWLPCTFAMSDSTIIVLEGDTDFDNLEQRPETLQMRRFDVGSRDEVRLDFTVDLTNALPADRREGSDVLVRPGGQGVFFIFQKTLREHKQYAYWVRCMDRDGRVIGTIDSLGSYARLRDARMTPIGRREGYIYFYIASESAFEVFAIEEGATTVTSVAKWSNASNPQVQQNPFRAHFLPTGDFYITVEHREYWQDEWRRYYRHYLSDRSVLDVSTSNIETSIVDVDILAYPNPARDQITVKVDVAPTAFLSFASMDGTYIHHDRLSEGRTTIDVSDWPPGMYTIEVWDDVVRGSTQTIVIR